MFQHIIQNISMSYRFHLNDIFAIQDFIQNVSMTYQFRLHDISVLQGFMQNGSMVCRFRLHDISVLQNFMQNGSMIYIYPYFKISCKIRISIFIGFVSMIHLRASKLNAKCLYIYLFRLHHISFFQNYMRKVYIHV